MTQTDQLDRPSESPQDLVVNNPGPEALEIMIEMIPDRYVLKPGDQLVIRAFLNGAPFDVTPYSGGMTIYAGNAFDPVVTINGVVVEPDWNTPS